MKIDNESEINVVKMFNTSPFFDEIVIGSLK